MNGWLVALGIMVSDSTEIFLIALLSGFTQTTSLTESIRPMARLAAVCILVPMVSCTGGATLLRFAYGVPFVEGWAVLVSRRRLGPADDHAAPAELDRSDVLDGRPRQVAFQTLALSALVAVVGYFDFHDALPGLFLAFPFLLLTTFRGRLLGATTAAGPLA